MPNQDSPIAANGTAADGSSTHSFSHTSQHARFDSRVTSIPSVQPKREPNWTKYWHGFLKNRYVAWIAPRLNFEDLKPVIRCSVSAWIGLLLILFHKSEVQLGQAAFFTLIVAFICPPSAPFIQSMELYLNLFFFVGIAWAWVCLAVFIAGTTRSDQFNVDRLAAESAKWSELRALNEASFQRKLIYDATFLQAKPAIVCAAFLAVGVGFFAWLKQRTAPSPSTFALVLSCICLDISLTLAPLYPTNLYTSGLLFYLPMAIQSGVSIVASLLLFPQSVSQQFQSRFGAIISPLEKALVALEELFSNPSAGVIDDDISDDDEAEYRRSERLKMWAEKGTSIRTDLLHSLAGVPPLRAQQPYLFIDFSYGRLSGRDLKDLLDLVATTQLRSGGLAMFFDVVNSNAKHTHLDSSAFSVHTPRREDTSRPGSRPTSRPSSIRGRDVADSTTDLAALSDKRSGYVTPRASFQAIDDDDVRPEQDMHPEKLHKKNHFQHLFHRSASSGGLRDSHQSSHVSLLESLRKIQEPVGVFESERYMDVERAQSQDTELILQQLDLLGASCLPLVKASKAALSYSNAWITRVNRDRSIVHFSKLLGRQKAVPDKEKERQELTDIIQNLETELEMFMGHGRLLVLKPYRHLFDPAHPPSDELNYRKVRHRALFWAFLAQYHLTEFATAALKTLKHIEQLDSNRSTKQFWYPKLGKTLEHMWRRDKAERTEYGGQEGQDENENHTEMDDVLGQVHKRNPEAVPHSNKALVALSYLSYIPDFLTNREMLFALKAGILTLLVSLPAYLESSASFFYYQRGDAGVWIIVMAQLTLALYAGDTVFAFLTRLMASFWGCLFGLLVWTIGCGVGKGNAYGLAVICAFAFPCAVLVRLYFPGHPLISILATVSFALVIGYSWINGSLGPLTAATWGWPVFVRRLVCVTLGITAAFIFSYVPPVSSGKHAIRISYARTISCIGSVLCEVLSTANDYHRNIEESPEIKAQVMAVRTKLTKLGARHATIGYEWSLRGRWPEDRYHALLDCQVDLMSLLSQLNHVLSQMERPWRKALMERTRLIDPTFIGDVLAVISMCSSALRSGSPLPQITPSPLIARFHNNKHHGFSVPAETFEPHSELPSMVTVEVLESGEYMRYALATTTTYSIISRLDRLVVICKTLVGETYHISGFELNHLV